eukprot:12643957-Alexandrium_andersonii.AAC.1
MGNVPSPRKCDCCWHCARGTMTCDSSQDHTPERQGTLSTELGSAAILRIRWERAIDSEV